MSTKQWQRARSTEQVEQRAAEILRAAERLFKTKPYEKITLQMIAREARFTQSNLYRYFKSKEEIFLSIYLEDLKAWEEDCVGSFTREMGTEDFIDLWTEVLCRQERMLLLSPLLAMVLERNSSEEVYRRTKLRIRDLMDSAIEALCRALPSLGREGIIEFLMVHASVMAGALPMSRFSPMQEKVLEELNMNSFKMEFRSFYRRTMGLFLKGLCEDASARS